MWAKHIYYGPKPGVYDLLNVYKLSPGTVQHVLTLQGSLTQYNTHYKAMGLETSSLQI